MNSIRALAEINYFQFDDFVLEKLQDPEVLAKLTLGMPPDLEEMNQEVNKWLEDVTEDLEQEKSEGTAYPSKQIRYESKIDQRVLENQNEIDFKKIQNDEDLSQEISKGLHDAPNESVTQKYREVNGVRGKQCFQWTKEAHVIVQNFFKECNISFKKVKKLNDTLSKVLVQNGQKAPKSRFAIIKHLNNCQYGCNDEYTAYQLRINAKIKKKFWTMKEHKILIEALEEIKMPFESISEVASYVLSDLKKRGSLVQNKNQVYAHLQTCKDGCRNTVNQILEIGKQEPSNYEAENQIIDEAQHRENQVRATQDFTDQQLHAINNVEESKHEIVEQGDSKKKFKWTRRAHNIIKLFLTNCTTCYDNLDILGSKIMTEFVAKKHPLPKNEQVVIKHLRNCRHGCNEQFKAYQLRAKEKVFQWTESVHNYVKDIFEQIKQPFTTKKEIAEYFYDQLKPRYSLLKSVRQVSSHQVRCKQGCRERVDEILSTTEK